MIRNLFLLVISSIVVSTATGVLASDPTSTQGRVNRNAFPLAMQRDRFTALPISVEKELRSRLDEVLVPIRVAPRSWFRASLGVDLTPADRRTILGSVSDTEIWKCVGSTCEKCPGDEGSGCVLSAKKAGEVGVVAVIHPCLYGDGKCARGAPTELKDWVEKTVLGIAYYKSGAQKNTSAFKKAKKSSSQWIENTSRSVNQLMAACPGPYSADSLKFLMGLEAITLPNTAIQRCGQKYLNTLRALPERCKSLGSNSKSAWVKFSAEHLKSTADILRCDSYCQKMLCRRGDTRTIFSLFSDRPTLLLRDNACEGEKPIAAGYFLREALPPGLRKSLEATACLPPLEMAESSSDGSVGTGSSSEVNLVD